MSNQPAFQRPASTGIEKESIPDIGIVIKNPTVRKWIYGAYAVVAIAVGATVAGFLAVTSELPAWVEISQAVIAYLAIPIGGLAAVNTDTGKS